MFIKRALLVGILSYITFTNGVAWAEEEPLAQIKCNLIVGLLNPFGEMLHITLKNKILEIDIRQCDTFGTGQENFTANDFNLPDGTSFLGEMSFTWAAGNDHFKPSYPLHVELDYSQNHHSFSSFAGNTSFNLDGPADQTLSISSEVPESVDGLNTNIRSINIDCWFRKLQ